MFDSFFSLTPYEVKWDAVGMHKSAQIQNVYCMQYVDALLAQAKQANSAVNRAAVAANAGFFPAYLSNLAAGKRKRLLPLYGEGFTYEGIAAALGTPWLTAGDLAAAGGMSLLDAPIVRASVNGGRIQPLTLTEAIFHNGRSGGTVVWPRCPCASEWEELLYQLGSRCPVNEGVQGIRKGLLEIAPSEDWALIAPPSEPAILQAPSDLAGAVQHALPPTLDQAPAHAYAEHMHGAGTFSSIAYWAHVSAYRAHAVYFQQRHAAIPSPEAVLYYLVQHQGIPLRVTGGLGLVGCSAPAHADQ